MTLSAIAHASQVVSHGGELPVHKEGFDVETSSVVQCLDVLHCGHDVFYLSIGQHLSRREFEILTDGDEERDLVDEKNVP